MKDIFILAAKRTPFGRFNGQLKDLSAKELGEIAVQGAIERAGIEASQVDSLILGNVMSAGLGQNVARQIALGSGMREETNAMVLNQVCGSSLKAVRVAQGLLELEDGIIAVGGVESMSNVPFLKARADVDNPETKLVDGLLNDGLMDAFSDQHMGITAENVAERFKVSREDQDEFVLSSHQKAYAAVNNDWFANEIIPITVDGVEIKTDQSIRPDTNLKKLATLKTIFKEEGTVTAGNSSPLNDGASMLILATQEKVTELGLKPIAKIGAYAEVGIDPEIMGYAPYLAIDKIFKAEETTPDDYDLFEINEAFSAQSVAVARDLQIPKYKLNIAGGALALGHPLGATGSRLIATIINNLENNQQDKGIVSLCIGGGMGIAYEIEMVK